MRFTEKKYFLEFLTIQEGKLQLMSTDGGLILFYEKYFKKTKFKLEFEF